MTDNEDLMREVRRRKQESIDADLENREEALDDFENLIGLQWPDDIRTSREQDGRPNLTINRLPQFVRQVTGDIRRMNPAIKVMAADNEATEDVAEIVEGLVRHIQQASDAPSVYEWAAECAAACGIGWFRIVADWVDDASFEQEIRIEQIKNPLTVYCDPMAQTPTRADANYLFIDSEIPKTDFERDYPDADPVDADRDAQIVGISNWYSKDVLTISEYFWKEPVTKTIALLADGSTVEDPVAAMPIVRKRKVVSHKVMWAKVSGKEVLEGPTEVPGPNIPVVCVTGEEWPVGDRIYRSGVIRFAKDPQRLYNYWRSAQTEMVALQPKAPFVMTAKQVAGFETYWSAANESNQPYLLYNPDEKAPGSPQRATPPLPSQGMMQEIIHAAEDLKATTGVYDAALGNRSNESSGVAIRQRQMESDVSTSIYSDNMGKAVRRAGEIIVGQIPLIYDTARVIRILGADDAEKMVPVNGVIVTQDGPMPVNPLTVGRYDVNVAVGPSYSTMRQEAAENMIEFVRAFPEARAVIADLIVKNMDWPGADEFAERLKKLLPPGVGVNEEEMTPEEQQQMAQAAEREQVQMQIAQVAQELELRKANAEAIEAEADAAKAQAEANGAYVGALAQTGQVEAMLAQMVNQRVGDFEGVLSEFAQGQQQMAGAMARLAQVMTASKRVVRDDEGQIVGVELTEG